MASPQDSPTDDADLVRHYLAGRDLPCPRCGYNLRGLGGDGCPECGLQFAPAIVPKYLQQPLESPHHRALRLRAYLADRDVPCPSCGGNLRGVTTTTCPTCQHPLDAWSLRPAGLDLTRASHRTGAFILVTLIGFWLLVLAGAICLVYYGIFGGP